MFSAAVCAAYSQLGVCQSVDLERCGVTIAAEYIDGTSAEPPIVLPARTKVWHQLEHF